ncbi:MAG: fibronectin type III domain-containing protein [Bacteroidales bacterium]|nr:fibronectin type III domain-containing protein [Bacteroidales bacterium]
MLKHLQKLLLIGAMLCVPWVTQAQSISDYTFSTGTDNTAWVTLSSSATEVTTIYDDDEGSAVMNIGFTFQFCGINYTQWSCNSNGRVCLGSTAVDGWWVNPFIATNLANTRNVFPLISAFGMDNTMEGTGVWCKYEVVGTAPNRMLVIEYRTPSEYDADGDLVNYQIQLEEGTNIVRFVYGTTAASTYDDFQIGLAYSATEVATVYGDTVHYGATNTTLNSWPGVNRYYEFTSPVVTCPRPTALSLSDITSSGATFSWMAGGTETTWLVSDGTTWYSTTDTFYTFTTLSAMTDYTLSVRALCSASDTSSANTIALRTACGALTNLPFVETFESYAASSTATIPCWTKGTNSTTAYPYPSSTVVNGTRCLYFYGYHPSSTTSTPIYSWAALPPIDDNLDMSDLQLNLLVKRYSSATNYYTTLLYIGIADSVNGLTSASAIESTVTWIDTIDLFSAAASSIHSEEVSFADYAGTGKYVVIYCPVPPLQGSSTYAYNYAYVDDVTLRTIPTCFWPTEVELANVAPNEAVISWTPDSRTSNPSAWNVEYGEHGFTLGQGITTTVTDTSITLSNLLANTQYDIYVSADCGNGDVSDPVMLAFRTQCSWLDEMPYSEGFESSTTGGTTSTNFVECMTRLNNGTQYFGYPYVSSSTTYVHSGTKGLYWYHTTTTGTYGDYEVVVLPGIDTTAIDMTDLVLSFYAKTTGSSYHPTPIVGVMTNPNDLSTFTPVYTFTNTEITTDWNIFSVPFTNYTGYGNYVAIRWNRPTSASYMCIDDIYLTDEWCDNPTDVTASAGVDEVTISWNSNGGTSFEVILGADTAINVTDTFYTFSNLNANTLYTYSVATECSNGNSVYINGSIRTLCTDLDSLPYSYGFEDMSTGGSSAHPVIPCWQHLNNASTYFGYPYVSSTTPHTGTRNLYWYGSTTTGTYGDYQIVALPGVDTNQYPINTLRLKFWARSTSTSYNVVFQVGVMTDPQDASTFTQVGTVNVGGNTTWAEYTTQLTNYHGQGKFVAVRALRPSSTWYAYTDDFTLEEIPSCPDITNLAVSGVTAGSALLTWNYTAGTEDTPIGYDVAYVENGNSTSPTTGTATDVNYMLTGLDAGTGYTFYVRADCGNGYGTWDSIMFSTQSLECLEMDESTLDTVNFSNSTSGISGCLAYSSYGNTIYQAIWTASELTTAGLSAGVITGIDLGFTSSSSYSKEFTIFMGTTSTSSISNATMEDPGQQVQVYGPASHPSGTSGWQHYDFTTPFVWDGTSNIIITTFMNQPTGSTQSSSSGLTGYYVSASNKARYRYKDSNPFTVTDYNSGNAGSTYSYRAAIHFYTGECQTMATCAAPVLSVTNVTADQVDLAWVPGYTESSWDLDYRVGNGTWQNELIGTSLTSYSFTNLTPATDYEFRLSHTCDTTTYTSTVSVHTPCVAVDIPFTENFDGLTTSTTAATNVHVNCWDYEMMFSSYSSASYQPQVYYSSTNAHSGNYSLRLYGSSITCLPMSSVPLDSLMLTFWEYNTSTSYKLDVGVMENDNFVLIESVNVPASTHQLVEVPLNTYTGTSRIVAFRNYYSTLTSTTGYSYHYIDDVTLDYIPTCPKPTNLAVGVAPNNNVGISWTEAGEATAWEYVYGPSGFNPDNMASSSYVATTTTSDSLNGLAPGAYDVYVRAVCDAEDVSSWLGPATFGVGIYTMGITGSDTLYTCGVIIADNGGIDGQYSANCDYTVVIYPDSPNSGLVISGSSYTESSFDYLRIYDGDSITGTQLWNDYGVSQHQTFGPIYTDGAITLTFHSDGSVYYDGFVLNVSCYHISTCPTIAGAMVSDVSNDQAVVTWLDTTNNAYNSFTLYWGSVNDIAWASDSATVSGVNINNYTITGLTGNTTYYVWIVGNCSDDYSRAYPVNFTTTPDCVPVENLAVAGTDYYAFGLNWDAPVAGHTATAYIVSWRQTGTNTWTSDTTSTPYYYVSGLNIGTPYDYKVTTICDTLVSTTNSGSVSTRGCGTLITEGGTNYSYLPTNQFYGYSYTQQLYYASELAGIDTIANISFHVEDGYENTTRSIVLYLGNTAKTSFTGTGDYIPAANLTQVYSGTISGTDWINLHLSTNFVRNADSNLVVVMDDNTGSYTSTIYWTSTATTTTRALYFYQDGTDITPSAPSASSSGSVNYVNQILLSGPTCVTPACGEPVIFVTGTTTNSINITWNAETGNTYEVAYRQVGATNWTVADANNTTGVCSITGLTPSADWNIRVLFDCNGDTLIGTRTASTLCGPAALPLTEDFQNHEYGVYARSCWTIGSTNLGTSYPEPYVISLQGATDNKLCLIYNGGYMILPQLDAPLNELQIRFKLTQGGDNVRFLMGTITDPAMPISSMHVLDTLIRSNIDTTTSTVNITYSFANIPEADTAAYICFWDAFNDNYSFLDDIVVEYIPLCTPATSFTVAATDSSAVITWDNDGENGTSYIIEYGPRYFTLGTGTQITSTGSPVTINGLTHSTSYDVYVYTVCGATGDTSIESQVIMFQTECSPYTTLPYFTDFENIMSPGSSATDVLPNCWAAESSVGTMPHIYYTSTSNYTSSPTHCFYFYSNGVAALPEMGVPLDTLMISFYDYNTAPSGYGLIIGTVDSITPGFEASFQPIDTVVYEPGSSNGYHVVSYLTDYTGTATRIALKNYNTNSSLTYSYHYIDDLTVDFVPACIAPQHVRTTLLLGNQADLAWTVSNASSYTVEYGAHGFTPGTGTVLTTTTRDISITGLTAQTQYDVYLVSGCGSDTTFYTFTTTCAAVTLPWSENFDSYTTSTSSATGVYVPCWGYTTTGTASYGTGSYLPQVYYSSTYAHSGSYSYRLYGAGYHTLPPMPTSLDSLQLTFWDYTTSAYYGLEVGVLEGSTFIPVRDIAPSPSTHVMYEIDFLSYTGNSRTIAFRNYYTTSSTTYYSYHYIDNISVDYIPTCPHVSNITSVGATVNSINVDWHDRVAASQWEIEYGVHGFTQGAGTSVTVTQHPATITGLDSATYYDVYVRPICSATDMGPWEMATLMSGICDGMLEFYTGNSTGTGYNAPVNNLWKYTLSEVIIDSAELYDAGFRAGTQIGKIAYSYNYATAMTDKTNVDIWIQPTTKTVFANTSDIVALNPTTAIQAYHGDLNCSQGWNYFECQDTLPITWDGHSNLMVIVDDNSNDYNSSTYTFHTTNCTGYKTITFYSDSYNPDVTSQTALASYSGSKTYYQYRPTMKLVSCGNAMCSAPNLLTPTNVDYQSATLNWTGNATDYEVAVKAATDPAYPAATAVNATTYTVNGLQPATTYLYHVRAMCDTTEGLISDWAEGTFTTDSLPCFAPTELHVVDSAYTTVTLGWTIGTSETSWNIHVWNTNFDTNYTVNTNPATVGGLATNMSFNAAVSALCGGGMVESEFGDTISFMTAMCAVPTGLTATNITTNSATITWNGTASSYELQYGEHGFPEGQGTVVTVNGNSYNLTGLDSETEYDVAVSAVCDAGNGVQSTYTARYSFETAEEIGIADVNGLNVNIYPNPTSNSTNITLSGVTGEVTIAIIDMNGRTVRSSTMSCDGDCATTIEVSDLASGAYFVRISGEGVNTVKKLVVK